MNNISKLQEVAVAICKADDKDPFAPSSVQGNTHCWQEYIEHAMAAIEVMYKSENFGNRFFQEMELIYQKVKDYHAWYSTTLG